MLGLAEMLVVPLPTIGFLTSLIYGFICVVVPATDDIAYLIGALFASFAARITSVLCKAMAAPSCTIRLAVSFSLVFVEIACDSRMEPMKELVTGSAGVTQSDGLNLFGLSLIIDIESSSAISDRILSWAFTMAYGLILGPYSVKGWFIIVIAAIYC